jgi:pimeloyl-ACP methyl ester carboxylesterase
LAAPFFSSKTLGKGKPTAVVLVHGLFSNGAFWLPYLKLFDDCQVTILNLDYPAFFEGGCALDALSQHIDAAVGERAPAHFIGHSFGSCVGLGLASAFKSRSFVCPTFCAAEFHSDQFCRDIAQMTGAAHGDAAKLIALAISYKDQVKSEAVAFDANDALYLSSDDQYFTYRRAVPGVASTPYLGGHFDVTTAMRMVRSDMDRDGA